MHARNRHQSRYDLTALTALCPALAPHVQRTPRGEDSIDFSNEQAVRLLNGALLQHWYGIEGWDLPPGYLCPPIPGRADYLHAVADLLAADHRARIPRGAQVLGLDVGVGANLVYPLIGHGEYGWHFIGSDSDAQALAHAQGLLDRNPPQAAALILRHQVEPATHAFTGIIAPDEYVDFSLCNPPFHASLADARSGSERKWKNLGRDGELGETGPTLNFGGHERELCCPGGELGFVQRMIADSVPWRGQVLWFTSLVSRESHLFALEAALLAAGAVEHQVVPMAQGQKQSRLLAWTFLPAKVRREWAQARWA